MVKLIEGIEKLIRALPLRDKIRLVRRLERTTWAQRLDEVTVRIRKSPNKRPRSLKSLTRLCEKVRQERHAHSQRSS